MQIIFQNNQQEKRLLIPNGLLLNRLTAELAAKLLTMRGIRLSGSQIRKLMQDVKAVRKYHPGWVLLEAEDAGGEGIKIII